MRISLHTALSHAKILVIVLAKKTYQLIILSRKVIQVNMEQNVKPGMPKNNIVKMDMNTREKIGVQIHTHGVMLIKLANLVSILFSLLELNMKMSFLMPQLLALTPVIVLALKISRQIISFKKDILSYMELNANLGTQKSHTVKKTENILG